MKNKKYLWIPFVFILLIAYFLLKQNIYPVKTITLNNQTNLFKYEVKIPEITLKNPDINSLNNFILSNAKSKIAQLEDLALDLNKNNRFFNIDLKIHYKVYKNNFHILSIVIYTTNFTNENNQDDLKAFNIYIPKKSILAFHDIFKPSAVNFIETTIRKSITEKKILRDINPDLRNTIFYFDNNNLIINYPPYTLSTQLIETTQFKLSKEQLKPFLLIKS